MDEKILNVKILDKIDINERSWKKDKRFLITLVISIIALITSIILPILISQGILDSFDPQVYITNMIFNININKTIYSDIGPNEGIGISMFFINKGNKEGIIEMLNLSLVNQKTKEEFFLIPYIAYNYKYNYPSCEVNENYPPFFQPIFISKKGTIEISYFFVQNSNYKKKFSPGKYDLKMYFKILGKENFEGINLNIKNINYPNISDRDCRLLPNTLLS